MDAPKPTARDLRDAAIAAVLARAVRAGEVQATDALRIIKHEMRQRNTNKKLTIKTRSVAVQAVIEKYQALGQPPPNNNSLEAPHADHVYSLSAAQLATIESVEDWLVELRRVREVVCVTAEENYRLQQVEAAGVTGPAKYQQAGITWADDSAPPFVEVAEPHEGDD